MPSAENPWTMRSRRRIASSAIGWGIGRKRAATQAEVRPRARTAQKQKRPRSLRGTGAQERQRPDVVSPESREGSTNWSQAGLLAPGSSFRRAFPPGLHTQTVANMRRSSPVTAARPRPILTAFPLRPFGHLQRRRPYGMSETLSSRPAGEFVNASDKARSYPTTGTWIRRERKSLQKKTIPV